MLLMLKCLFTESPSVQTPLFIITQHPPMTRLEPTAFAALLGPPIPARFGDSPVTRRSPHLSPPIYHPLLQRGEMVPLRQLNSCQRGGIFACVADAENTSQRYFK